MKNFINYYYGFYINNIYFSNNKYFFQIGNEKYMLQTCENTTITSYCNEINYQLNQYYYFFSFIKLSIVKKHKKTKREVNLLVELHKRLVEKYKIRPIEWLLNYTN